MLSNVPLTRRGRTIGILCAALVGAAIVAWTLLTSPGLGIGHDLLMDGVRSDQLALVRFLLEVGVDPDGPSWLQQGGPCDTAPTPLIRAVDKRNLPMIDALLEGGASVDMRWECLQCGTALSCAIDWAWMNGIDATAIVDRLLAAGANPNARMHLYSSSDYWHGEPLLVWVSRDCDVESARRLLNAGARVNVRDDHGWTPLTTAFAVGCQPVIELLLAHGADASQIDGDSKP